MSNSVSIAASLVAEHSDFVKGSITINGEELSFTCPDQGVTGKVIIDLETEKALDKTRAILWFLGAPVKGQTAAFDAVRDIALPIVQSSDFTVYVSGSGFDIARYDYVAPEVGVYDAPNGWTVVHQGVEEFTITRPVGSLDIERINRLVLQD